MPRHAYMDELRIHGQCRYMNFDDRKASNEHRIYGQGDLSMGPNTCFVYRGDEATLQSASLARFSDALQAQQLRELVAFFLASLVNFHRQ
jgi:hypothetical protein